jgi:glutaredoxin
MAIHKAQAMIQESSDISYKVFKLGVDFGREEMLTKFPTARTFPQIVVDEQNIGGWQEFQKI